MLDTYWLKYPTRVFQFMPTNLVTNMTRLIRIFRPLEKEQKKKTYSRFRKIGPERKANPAQSCDPSLQSTTTLALHLLPLNYYKNGLR